MACVSSDAISCQPCSTLLSLSSPEPERTIDGISLKRLITAGDIQSRPRPIGFWKYNAAGEQKNQRWMPADMTRGYDPHCDQRGYRLPKLSASSRQAERLRWRCCLDNAAV